jgi:hypothetical protein
LTNRFSTSPAIEAAQAARGAIDHAARAIRELPFRLDRAAIAGRLARAAQLLYVVQDSEANAPVHLDALSEATRALEEARERVAAAGDPRRAPALGRALAPLDASIAALTKASEAVGDLQMAARGGLRARAAGASHDGEPTVVSTGTPRLHSIARAPLVSTIELEPREPIPEARAPRPPPPAKPRSIEELRAQACAARAPGPETPRDRHEDARAEVRALEPTPLEHAVVGHVARDCLEDIASLRVLRKPSESESWVDQAPFEQRLLDNLDAFASLGARALSSVTVYHAEAAAPDPGRAFAVALTLGCIAGRDAVDAAVATLVRSAPEEHWGWVEGLSLASSPDVDTRVTELLDGGDNRLARLALGVLGWRGGVPAHAASVSLARRDAEVDLSLAHALGRALPRDGALNALRVIADRAESDALFDACVESLLRRGDGEIRGTLRSTLRAGPASRRIIAARWLALAGSPEDTASIVEVAAATPSPALLRALGRHGDLRSVDVLIASLSADEPIVEAAAEALDRITGAGLREKAEVAWSTGAEPGSAKRIVERPSRDPVLWSQWFGRSLRRLDPGAKLRQGKPFIATTLVDELASPATPAQRRDDAEAEISIVAGVTSRFRTDDWVARQQERLVDLRARVTSRSIPSGTWCYAGAPWSRR